MCDIVVKSSRSLSHLLMSSCCVFRVVKYYFKAEVELECQVWDTDRLQRTIVCFYIPPVISSAESLDLQNLTATLQNSIESFTSRGSGWNVSCIRSLSLCIGVFRPTAGSSFIPTSAEIANKMAIINVRNHTSNDCFQYSILAALHPATNHRNHLYTYSKYLKQLDMTGIQTPVAR